MRKVTSSVSYSGGFIENLNLVAEHIRQVDDSIYQDVNRLVYVAMQWATAPYGVEPEPALHPGEYSSEHYSTDSSTSVIAVAYLYKKYPEDCQKLLDELTELTSGHVGRALNPFFR